MARLWTCGFELQSVTAGVEVAIATGGPTISTTVKRSGAASLRCAPTASNSFVEHQLTAGVVQRTFHRFYLRIDALPSATASIYSIGQNGYFPAMLRLTTSGTLRLYDVFLSTDLGTASAPLTLGQWYRIELDLTDVVGAESPPGTRPKGDFVGYIDGVDFSGTTSCSNINGFSRLRAGTTSIVSTLDMYIDDIAVNDTSGSVQTGLPGPGNVVHLKPNAAGDANGWATAVGGTAGAGNNFTRVNETTPNDATSYNQTALTGTTTIDDLNLDSCATAGIPAGERITLVAVGGRVGSIAATAASIVYRIKSQAAGTVLESASVSVALNGWATHKAAAPFVPQLTSYTDPQAGGPWTQALLDTAQIGYRTNVAQTTTRRVSTLWALAESVPLVTSALGVADGTGTAQALTRIKRKTLGTATETDTAETLPVTVTVGLAGETATARTVTQTKRTGVAPAIATATAQALGHTRSRSLPQVGETTSGQSLGSIKQRALAAGAEEGTAQTLASSKALTAGTAAETAAAQSVAGAKQQNLTGAQVVSNTQALGQQKISPLAPAAQSDTTQGIGGGKAIAATTSVVGASAQPFTGAKIQALPPAAEQDQGLSLAAASGLVPADETNAAQPLAQGKRQALGIVNEQAQALAAGKQKTEALGITAVADAARPLAGTKQQHLEQAAETATTQPITLAGGITPAEESAAVQQFAAHKAQVLQRAEEITAPRAVTGGRRHPLAAGTVTATALSLGRAKTRQLGITAETATARPLDPAQHGPALDTVTAGTPRTRWASGAPRIRHTASSARAAWSAGTPHT